MRTLKGGHMNKKSDNKADQEKKVQLHKGFPWKLTEEDKRFLRSFNIRPD